MSDPTGPGLSASATQLLKVGVLDGAGSDVDMAFFALKGQMTEELALQALNELADLGVLERSEVWHCAECGRGNGNDVHECTDCHVERAADAQTDIAFTRRSHHGRTNSRDPAALFLVHGMNTLGSWQESVAWKLPLLHGYSVPVFVFKYGNDKLSPLSEWSQRRRSRQLCRALRAVQDDLRASGRSTACDIVAHSFGTLLVSRVLQDPEASDILIGKVILTGSIVPRSFNWSTVVTNGRVEGVLNHRAGSDFWVRVAPWIFPRVGASGVHGFLETRCVEEFLSSSYGHSDYFAGGNLDGTIRTVWRPFLNTAPRHDTSDATEGSSRRIDRRYWVGRAVFLLVVATAVVFTF